jgi:hypothetical protein
VNDVTCPCDNRATTQGRFPGRFLALGWKYGWDYKFTRVAVIANYLVFILITQDKDIVNGGLPSRTDYLPQQPPPRKKVMTRITTTAIITHSI